jgi:alkylation response protein AidB-like acyl-CoA dehydrogenase
MQHLNEEEAFLVETVRAFIDRDVKPTVRDVEHANEYPEQWIKQMKEIGIYGLAVPEEYGGMPVSMPCYAQVTEELARGWMSLAGAMGGHTVVAKLLSAFGTDEQKRKFLPGMATGEIRATMALTEPGGGSDLQAMTTIARIDGDDLVINGSKTWISNARRSSLIALLCKTDPDTKPRHKGISIVLVEHGPGLDVSRDLPKLGYKGVESCEVNFTDYRISKKAILGGEAGKGFPQMMRGLETGRIQVAARALGVVLLHLRTHLSMPRCAKASASRSGSISPSATTSPTWRRSSLLLVNSPDSLPKSSKAVSAAIWSAVWPSSLLRRSAWRSRSTRYASSVATGIPPSTTSSVTSVTRRS